MEVDLIYATLALSIVIVYHITLQLHSQKEKKKKTLSSFLCTCILSLIQKMYRV